MEYPPAESRPSSISRPQMGQSMPPVSLPPEKKRPCLLKRQRRFEPLRYHSSCRGQAAATRGAGNGAGPGPLTGGSAARSKVIFPSPPRPPFTSAAALCAAAGAVLVLFHAFFCMPEHCIRFRGICQGAVTCVLWILKRCLPGKTTSKYPLYPSVQ